MNIGQRIFGATAVTLTSQCCVCHNNSALAQLNDCIEGLLHLRPNVITFRALLLLGQLLHLGLQQGLSFVANTV